MEYKHVGLLLVLAFSSVHCDPRNLHGKCSIRINEIFLGQNTEGFVEIGKICPKDKPLHENTNLRGFAIIILKANNNNLICIHLKKLDKDQLQEPAITPAVAMTQSAQSMNFNAPDRSLAAAEAAARDRSMRSSLNSPETLTTTALTQQQGSANRKPRDASEFELQPNANLFFVLKTHRLQHITNGFLTVILLHMDSRKAKQRLPCKINQKLNNEDVLEIKDCLHDITILHANGDHGTINILNPLLQPNKDVASFLLPVLAQDTENKGFSKCNFTVDIQIASVFKRSQLTEGNKNLCKSSAKSINKLFQFPYSFQGSNLRLAGKKLVLNLVSSLTFYKDDKTFLEKSPRKLAASLLNIAESSISRFETQKNKNTISKPNEKRKGYSKVMASMDETKRELLYKSITTFYAQNKVATIPQIHLEFVRLVKHHQLVETEQRGPVAATEEDEDLFTCCLSTFRKLLEVEGYKFGKLALRDSVIFEPKKILWRRRYLNRMRLNRETKEFDVLYLDETYIDPHSRVTVGLVKKCYTDFKQRRSFTYKDHKVSRGGRIIIIACGGKNGFIQQSNLVYKVSAKQTKEDYHQNLNKDGFIKWFTKLMDNVEGHDKKYIFVIDNAPYHTTLSAPRSNANKAEMVSFLEKEQRDSGLVLPDNYKSLLYVELKEIVKKIKDETPRYTIDDLARSRGHEIVRIPPYNCDLNPIEAVWKDIKTQVKKDNAQQNIDVQVIQARNALLTYTAEYWNRHITHVEKLEDEYYIGDMAFDTLLNENINVRAEAERFSTQSQCNIEEENNSEDIDASSSESENE